LVRSTGLEQSTLSRNLRTLEGRGLIEIAVVGATSAAAPCGSETGARRLEAAIPLAQGTGKLALCPAAPPGGRGALG
jgi:hypothetical protein